MVIQSYDRNGQLIGSTQCTENRSASVTGGNKAVSGGLQAGGGTSCTSLGPSSSGGGGSRSSGKLVIEMPYQGSM